MKEKKLKFEYYPIYFEYKNLKGYLIWFTEVIEGWSDGLVTDNNKILYFNSLNSLNNFAIKNNLFEKPFSDSDLAIYDMKPIEKIINNGLKNHKNNTIMLNTWNLLNDICSSIYGSKNRYIFEIEVIKKYKNTKKVKRKYLKKIYNKIFSGNNLPFLTPKGKYYVPIWNKSEKRLIIRVLKKGMTIFEENLIYEKSI